MAKRKARKPQTSAALSLRHQRFVDEYLVDLNATQAAIRAGYRGHTADRHGHRLLKKAEIAAAIAARQAERAETTGITQERVLLETALLSFSDVTHYQVDANGNVTLAPGAPPDAMRAVQSIKRKFGTTIIDGTPQRVVEQVEIKLWDKPGPLKLAGRHVGLFPDKVEVSGPDGGPIPVAAIQRVVVDVRTGDG